MDRKAVGFAGVLLRWYDRHRRRLPWRTPTGGRLPDPWHVLVSEVMLQQTTVATVQPYFRRFIDRFPTAAALAAADEHEVLRLWQGLGYYSRARNLRAAAIRIVTDFAGNVPCGEADLLSLPGVGRYTAGAVGSLAFGQRVPIVDANVARLLCRLDRIETDPRTPATQRILWARATQILPRTRVGDFNSGLMELGATVCRPRNPLCPQCPLKRYCRAFAGGVQNENPIPRQRPERPKLRRLTFCIRDGDRWLVEQRPVKGRWGGMWQFITIPADEALPTTKLLGRVLAVSVGKPRLIGEVDHQLSHREYHFDVYLCVARAGSSGRSVEILHRRWVTMEEFADYPKPRPHVRVVGMIGEMQKPS